VHAQLQLYYTEVHRLQKQLEEQQKIIQIQQIQITTQESELRECREWKKGVEKSELYNKVLEYGKKGREQAEQLTQQQQIHYQQHQQLFQQQQINNYQHIIIEGIISEHERNMRECNNKIKQFHNYITQQTEKIQYLTTEITEQELKISHATHTETLLNTITDNILELYYQLAKHQKYSICKQIMKEVPEKIIAQKLRVPLITAQRIIAHTTTKQTTTKILRKPEQVSLAKKILGDLLPVVSGRMWRVQLMTDKELYRRYVEEVKKVGKNSKGTDKALSKKRVKQILRGWRIHHSTDTSQCPTCKFLEQYDGKPPPQNLLNNPKALKKHQNKLIKHKQHKLIAQTQHNIFKANKQHLIDTQSTDTMIILQDFTQLEPQSGFNQDMILTLLTYDAEVDDMIRRRYLHFVGENTDKNDVFFVMAVWEHMLRSGVIGNNIKHIIIWSDGGGKHFKLKEAMYYFSTIKSRHNKTITYNFYQSYHGHNSCDAAASHAKKRISTQQRDNPNKQIHTSTDLVNAIKTLNNHSAQNVPKITKTQMNVSIMKGIKSYFKFTFPRENRIHAFNDSATHQPAIQWTVMGTLPNFV
jgi:hypothetical protein